MSMVTDNRQSKRNTTVVDKLVGGRIRLVRNERKISQSALASEIGVTFQQVQKYEKGTNRVTVGRLQQIARTLNAPISFFYEEGKKAHRDMQTLLLDDGRYSLRLLRAYNAIPEKTVKRRLLTLMESVAGITATDED